MHRPRTYAHVHGTPSPFLRSSRRIAPRPRPEKRVRSFARSLARPFEPLPSISLRQPRLQTTSGCDYKRRHRRGLRRRSRRRRSRRRRSRRRENRTEDEAEPEVRRAEGGAAMWDKLAVSLARPLAEVFLCPPQIGRGRPLKFVVYVV